MKLGDIVITAFSNLTRRKVRTFLTSLGVTVGIFTIVVMLSLAIGVQTKIKELFSSVGLENVFVEPRNEESDDFNRFLRPIRENPITDAKIAEWQALPGVLEVQPMVNFNRSLSKRLRLPNDDTSAIGIYVDQGFEVDEPFQAPPVAAAGEFRPSENGLITISQQAANALNLAGEPQSLLGKQVQIVLQSPRGEEQTFDYTISGITTHEHEHATLTPEASLELKAWWFNDPNLIETQGYDEVRILAEDLTDARTLVPLIREQGFEVQSLETILDLASRIFLVINIMLGSVGGLALFVASIGITNTMIMSIYERTREIGTLKAIGASRSNVRWLFMAEAGMIGLLGGVIGLLFGWLAGLGLNALAVEYLQREAVPLEGPFFVIPPWLILMAIGFAMLIGVLAGVYPAARAARLDPIKALRHE